MGITSAFQKVTPTALNRCEIAILSSLALIFLAFVAETLAFTQGARVLKSSVGGLSPSFALL